MMGHVTYGDPTDPKQIKAAEKVIPKISHAPSVTMTLSKREYDSRLGPGESPGAEVQTSSALSGSAPSSSGTSLDCAMNMMVCIVRAAARAA